MNFCKKSLQKTLFYNLILFDFILLESSSKKISNFFIEKFKVSNVLLAKLPLFPIIKNFKRFIRLLYFLKGTALSINKSSLIANFQSLNFFYILVRSEPVLEFFKLLFKQFRLSCLVSLNLFLPFNTVQARLKTGLIFDYPLSLRNFFSFFFKNFYSLQVFNSFEDTVHFLLYKIFTDLSDYKKLIFLGLIFISIFKK